MQSQNKNPRYNNKTMVKNKEANKAGELQQQGAVENLAKNEGPLPSIYTALANGKMQCR